ncbi:TetR family transcriptional regulator [Streptomyces sp. NPDC015171]|uniref:TetR family transcriptional regulator n=1 Tax=Streptomyces sp. NPDC015171 TaxID=3364945 RepID=UPI0037019FD3
MKQIRARQTRARLLDAAAEEFAVHGYAATKLQAVVARTGMTKGALYGHFPSKRHLATALVTESAQQWRRLGGPGPERAVPADAILAGLIREIRGQLQTNVRFRAALRLAADCELAPSGSPGLFEGIRGELVTSVRRAQEEKGLARSYPAETVAYLILALVYGASHLPPWESAQGGTVDPNRAWELLRTALSLG